MVLLEIVAEVMLARPSSGYRQEIWGAPKNGAPPLFYMDQVFLT